MPIKAVSFSHLPIPLTYSDTLLKFELHQELCLSQLQKFQVLEALYRFSKFLAI